MMSFNPTYFRFGCVDSTNDLALKFAEKGAQEGTVVTALTQKKGRGRRGNQWWDSAGQSLLMSIVTRPGIDRNNLFKLSFSAAMATIQSLKKYLYIDSLFKWPNDIYVNNKKIGGILVEASITKENKAVIMGIGVNIKQTSFPDEIKNTATSAKLEGSKEVDIDSLSEKVTENFAMLYNICLEGRFENDILPFCISKLWAVGKEVKIMHNEETICGVIKTINKDGSLLIESKNGFASIYASELISIKKD